MNIPLICGAVTMLTGSSTPSSGADISKFLEWATSILTWMLTGFTSVLTWMLANPIVFVWLVVSLIGVVFVFLRRTIGG